MVEDGGGPGISLRRGGMDSSGCMCVMAVMAVSGSVALLAVELHRRLAAEFVDKVQLELGRRGGGGGGGGKRCLAAKKPAKKVRFAADVVEPSSNNEEYRRRRSPAAAGNGHL